MKNILTLVISIAFLLLLNAQFAELAYKLGFAELKTADDLQNQEKMKVKCDAYGLISTHDN